MSYASPHVLDTVADLTTSSAGELSSNLVSTLGFSSINDGLGGVFCWSAASLATADGVNVIQPSSVPGAGRWIRVSGTPGETPSVIDYGAIGDGIANDTAALQAAFDALRDGDIRALYIPAGTYKAVNLDLTEINSDFSASSKIFGDGRFASILSQTTGGTGNFIDISGSNNLQFVDLCIEPGPNSDTGVLATRLDGVSGNCNGNSFTNVWIKGSTTQACFVGIGCESTLFFNCRFDTGSVDGTFYLGSYNNIGAASAFGTILETVPTTDNHVIACKFVTSLNSGVLIWLSDSAGVAFTDCSTNNSGVGTLTAHVYVDVPQSNQYGWTTIFDKHHFEGDGDCFLFADSASPPTNAVYENFNIINSVCINTGFKWITVGGTDVAHTGLTFTGNKGAYPIELQDVQLSYIRHVETGATIDFAGAADACDIFVPDGGLTGSVLGSNVRTVALYADEDKNYQQFGADVGQASMIARWVPTTTAPVAGNLSEGVVFLAKPPGWDPLSRGGTDSYFTRWTGSAWGAL
jgi:hypothetical protein